jgi:hypothetical protein
MQVPDLVLSNYFYREMSTVLRWVLLSLLLLAGVTTVAIAGELFRIEMALILGSLSPRNHSIDRLSGGDHLGAFANHVDLIM